MTDERLLHVSDDPWEYDPVGALGRRGYRIFNVDAATGKRATLLAEEWRPGLRLNNICVVHCADGAPAETLNSKEWETAPCFIDEADGAMTWWFRSIGDVFVSDCIGYAVASYAALPVGFEERFEQLTTDFPNRTNTLRWMQPPPHIDWLPTLPTALRDEIAYIRAQEEVAL